MTTYADMVSETGDVNRAAIMRIAHAKAKRRWEGQTYGAALAKALTELWAMVRVTVDCRKATLAVRALPVAEQERRRADLADFIATNGLGTRR